MRRAALILTAVLVVPVALAPRPALACSPSPRTVSPEPVRGPSFCEYRIDLNETDVLRLSPLAGIPREAGLMSVFHGNGCLNRQDLVVIDCAAGSALLVGPEAGGMEAERPPFGTGLEAVMAPLEQALDEGEGIDPARVTALAHDQGFDAPVVLALSEGLARDGHVLPLDCLCSESPWP